MDSPLKSPVLRTTFLEGKVFKVTLPIIPAPPDPQAPRLKRLALPQGELAQFYDGEEGIHYLAALELRAGIVRGNHYHRVKNEWLYVLNGEILLAVQDLGTQLRSTFPLGTGEVAFIPTDVAHAFRTVQPGQALEFSATRFDPEDTHRFHLL